MQSAYGGLAKARLPARKAPVREPVQRAERVVRLPAPTPTPKILIGYHAPSFLSPHTPALVVANEILFGGRSSRLHRLLCVDKEIAVSVRGSISPFVDPGLYEMWIAIRDGARTGAVLALLEREFDRLASRGPTQGELEKAINQLELSFLHTMETAGGKAEQIGFHETVLNDGAAVFDRVRSYKKVRADQVRRMVGRYLRPSRRTRVEIVPRSS
jgi:zinc protease